MDELELAQETARKFCDKYFDKYGINSVGVGKKDNKYCIRVTTKEAKDKILPEKFDNLHVEYEDFAGDIIAC